MPKLGLKLWSTNTTYANISLELHQKRVFDYIELYVVPGTKKICLDQWKEKSFSYILHAPHDCSGFNLSLRSWESRNRLLIEEVESFRVALKPMMIIFHPGIHGFIHEITRQILLFKKDYPGLFNIAVIENLPKIGIKGEICLGASPEEIERLMHETGLGFCLDIGHAICYAAWAGVEWRNVIDQFMRLNPNMFHLSDGNVNSQTDLHLSFGEGNYELSSIIKRLPSQAYVSIETKKNSKLNLNDFEKDVVYFKECEG
jgi:endonuclease IV